MTPEQHAKRLAAQKRCRDAASKDPVRAAALKQYRKEKFAEYYARPEFRERICSANRARRALRSQDKAYRDLKNSKARAAYAERVKIPGYREKINKQAQLWAQRTHRVRVKPSKPVKMKKIVIVVPVVPVEPMIVQKPLVLAPVPVTHFDYEELVR